MNVHQKPFVSAQNTPESADVVISDVPVMQDDTTPTEADLERQRIWQDITYQHRVIGKELCRMWAGGHPARRMTKRQLLGLQERFTGTVHRLRELQEKGSPE